MKIVRKLTIPVNRPNGDREYSGFEIEISSEEITQLTPVKSVQDMLQSLCLEAQARVLACHVADGSMTNDEMSQRLSGFLGPTPEWLNNLQKLEPPK